MSLTENSKKKIEKVLKEDKKEENSRKKKDTENDIFFLGCLMLVIIVVSYGVITSLLEGIDSCIIILLVFCFLLMRQSYETRIKNEETKSLILIARILNLIDMNGRNIDKIIDNIKDLVKLTGKNMNLIQELTNLVNKNIDKLEDHIKEEDK